MCHSRFLNVLFCFTFAPPFVFSSCKITFLSAHMNSSSHLPFLLVFIGHHSHLKQSSVASPALEIKVRADVHCLPLTSSVSQLQSLFLPSAEGGVFHLGSERCHLLCPSPQSTQTEGQLGKSWSGLHRTLGWKLLRPKHTQKHMLR